MSLHRASLADILRYGRGPAIWPHGGTLEGEVHMPALRMAGFLTVEVIRRGRVRQRLEFRNMLTDAFLNAVGAGTFGPAAVAGAGIWIGVGTGTTAPAVNQTALVAEILPRKTVNLSLNTTSGPSFAYVSRSGSVTWTETEVNGNLAEFGVFSASTAGTMFARQLFRDALGNPAVVTKTAADQLRLTYEVRMYPPASTADVPGVSVISGVNYDWISNVASMNNPSVVFSATAVAPSALVGRAGAAQTMPTRNANASTGSHPAASSQLAAAYTSGTFYRDVEYTWEPANITTPIGRFVFTEASGTANGVWWVVFPTTAIPKDSTKRLKLSFRHSWGRYP